MEAVTTALIAGISNIASEGMTAIGGVIPVAMPVMGTMVVIGLGLAIFRKVTGR